MRRTAPALLLVALIAIGCAPKTERQLREPMLFQCRRAQGQMSIDGKLDEASWDRAQSIDVFRVPVTGEKPQALSRAKFLWDDQFLYIAVIMEDRDVYGVKRKHDDKTWEDDVAEVFIKPSDASPVYYEFHCNPIGTTLDLMFGRRRAGHFDRWWPWESGMRAKANVQGTVNNWRDKDQAWLAEMAIPLDAFQDATPRAQLGDRWRFAVSRYNYSVYIPSGLERTSTAPLTEMDFHRYEDFDWIEFAE
jgi:hypothetical protein